MRGNAPARSRRGDDGFTLVEMAVVLVVVAVLVAIAVPTFLNARDRASNRSAQARTNTGLKAHKAELSDNPNLLGLTAADIEARLEALEPSLRFEVAPPAGTEVKGVVYVRKEPGSPVVSLVSRSQSGTCYWTMDENGVSSFAAAPCGTDYDDLVFGDRWQP